VRHVDIHGHRVAYVSAGEGPTVLLIHGMASSSETWQAVLPALAERACVVAPDLPGHGGTAPAAGDYSLGALASGVRDLLVALGHERATVVGHSLGGGVAMQFAYQFPERCERLVLVSSGGLGRDVSSLLRVLTLPGAEYVLALACTRQLREAGTSVGRRLGSMGIRPAPALKEIWRSYESLDDSASRAAFLQTLRSVVDLGGQRVSAGDRLYLASEIPTLLVWGERDAIIPVKHARAAHDAIPASRLEIFEGVGHFPHCEAPERFLQTLVDFLDSTESASISEDSMRERIQGACQPKALPVRLPR